MDHIDIDIERLAQLARIELSQAEAEIFRGEIVSILGYVSEINQITSQVSGEKEVGPLHNVFREDGNPNTPHTYTNDILREAPDRDGAYVRVKKILGGK